MSCERNDYSASELGLLTEWNCSSIAAVPKPRMKEPLLSFKHVKYFYARIQQPTEFASEVQIRRREYLDCLVCLGCGHSFRMPIFRQAYDNGLRDF
jgi:hypothetical protein